MAITRVHTKRTDTGWSEVAVPRQLKKQTRLHGTAPWQTGCPAIAPPHSVHEAAKWAGLAALLRCFRLYTEQEIPHMVESACLHSPTPSTFYTRANGKSKLDKSTSQMPVLFLTLDIVFLVFFFTQSFFFLVCFKNLWMCSNIHKINVFFLKNKKIENNTHIHTACCRQINKVAPV